MNLEMLERVREEVASIALFDMRMAHTCIAGCCNRLTKFDGNEWCERARAARESMGLSIPQAMMLFNSAEWPVHLHSLDDRTGALYLLDGMILSERLARLPEVLHSQVAETVLS